jgi:hypothetical protein
VPHDKINYTIHDIKGGIVPERVVSEVKLKTIIIEVTSFQFKMRSVGVIVTLLATLFLIAQEVECLVVVLEPPKGKRELHVKTKISNPQQGRLGQDDWRMKKLYQVI